MYLFFNIKVSFIKMSQYLYQGAYSSNNPPITLGTGTGLTGTGLGTGTTGTSGNVYGTTGTGYGTTGTGYGTTSATIGQ